MNKLTRTSTHPMMIRVSIKTMKKKNKWATIKVKMTGFQNNHIAMNYNRLPIDYGHDVIVTTMMMVIIITKYNMND